MEQSGSPSPSFIPGVPARRPCTSSDVWTDRCLFCHDFLLFPDNGYRECLANGSWAARVNYSECQEILNEEVRIGHHTEGQARATCTSLPHGQLWPGNFSEAGIEALP